MKALLTVVLVAFDAALVVAQQQATPATQYEQLLREYSTVGGAFRAATTDLQRKQDVDRFAQFPRKFIALAEQHPDDPVALLAFRQAIQAVVSVDSQTQYCWELNREQFPVGIGSDSSNRIVELLLRDHLPSDQLAPICDRMRYSVRNEFQKFLSAAMQKNPHRDIQGLACLALAQLLRNQLYVVDRVSARPEWVTRYNTILGKDYFQTIRGAGRKALVKRVEGLYEQAARFDDVTNFSFSETVAAKAATELFEMRHLSIGKEAPNVEGQDQDARPMKLSDYRGKVVLLYFWLEY